MAEETRYKLRTIDQQLNELLAELNTLADKTDWLYLRQVVAQLELGEIQLQMAAQ